MRNIRKSSSASYTVALTRGGVEFYQIFTYRDLEELREYTPDAVPKIGKTIFATEAEAIAAARAFRDDVIAQYEARGKEFLNEQVEARLKAQKAWDEVVAAKAEPWLLKLGDRSEEAVRMVLYFVTHEHHQNYRDIMSTDNPVLWIARAIDLYRKGYRLPSGTGVEYGCFTRAALECRVGPGDNEGTGEVRVVSTADVESESGRKRGFLARLLGKLFGF